MTKSIYRNKNNLNKSNYTYNDQKNFNNNYLGTFQTAKENKSKEKLFKSKNVSFNRICNTPDRNIKYNIGITPNKNNVSVLKLTNKNNRNLFGYHRYKSLYNSHLSNENKKTFTPNKVNNFSKTKKMKESQSKNNSFLVKDKFLTDYSKSFCGSDYDYIKNTSDKYIYSINHQQIIITKRIIERIKPQIN